MEDGWNVDVLLFVSFFLRHEAREMLERELAGFLFHDASTWANCLQVESLRLGEGLGETWS